MVRMPGQITGGRVSWDPGARSDPKSRTVRSFPAEASQRPEGANARASNGIGMAVQQRLDSATGVVMQAHGIEVCLGASEEPPTASQRCWPVASRGREGSGASMPPRPSPSVHGWYGECRMPTIR